MDEMTNNEFKIGQTTIQWNESSGSLNFEGDDAILLWTKTALKTFINTIEEVAGDDSARLVLETAGYRTGEDVSRFYKSTGKSIEAIIEYLPSLYRSAGWGQVEITEYSLDKRTAMLRLNNDWEERVIRAQGKSTAGAFIPGHWAGVLSGLFATSIWYEITASTFEGSTYTEISYFPSQITPKDNIHDSIRKKEQQAILELERKVDQRTRELSDLVNDLSSPLIPVIDGITVLPLMGKFEENRSSQLIEKVLSGLLLHKPSTLIVDITGINSVDDYILELLNNLTKTITLMGVKPFIVGISPQISMQLTERNITLNDQHCFATLKHAINEALSMEGLEIAPVKKTD
ncbi:STAS domain-containing protein [Bacillus infantis]|nr:STAS domain-containing protein [Bacillus infantis]MCA1040447.1 STAS domain-containing protein [Bacillus infantis]